MSKLLESAVRTVQIYHGCNGRVAVRDEQRLYRRMQSAIKRVAKHHKLTEGDAHRQLTEAGSDLPAGWKGLLMARRTKCKIEYIQSRGQWSALRIDRRGHSVNAINFAKGERLTARKKAMARRKLCAKVSD